jgi:hypothetical protein
MALFNVGDKVVRTEDTFTFTLLRKLRNETVYKGNVYTVASCTKDVLYLEELSNSYSPHSFKLLTTKVRNKTMNTAYTLKIKFNKHDSKIYHYASKYRINSDYAEVSTPDGMETVHVVGCDEGISLNATKWRTGSLVTSEQRQKWGVGAKFIDAELKETDIVRELASACNTLNKYSNVLFDRGVANGLGFSCQGRLYVNMKHGNEKVSSEFGGNSYEPSLPWITAVADLIAQDTKKKELVSRLEEIKREAADIAAEIAKL